MTWMILQVLSITIQAQQLAAGSSFGTLWNSAWKRQTQQGETWNHSTTNTRANYFTIYFLMWQWIACCASIHADFQNVLHYYQVAVSQGCTVKEKTWYDLTRPIFNDLPSHPHISIRLKSLREAMTSLFLAKLVQVNRREGTAWPRVQPSDERVANLEPLGMSEGS